MIFVKKLKFFHLLCLSKIDREKVFADVLDKKEAFKRKIRIFPKGLVHRFGQKLEISLTLIFYLQKTKKKYLGTFELEKRFL